MTPAKRYRCPGCKRMLPLSAYYMHIRDGRQSLCQECQRAGQRSVVDHRTMGAGADRRVPIIPGECLIAGCHWPAEVDADGAWAGGAWLCAYHQWWFRESPESQDLCACGRPLIGMYALARGVCFECAFGFGAITVTGATLRLVEAEREEIAVLTVTGYSGAA